MVYKISTWSKRTINILSNIHKKRWKKDAEKAGYADVYIGSEEFADKSEAESKCFGAADDYNGIWYGKWYTVENDKKEKSTFCTIFVSGPTKLELDKAVKVETFLIDVGLIEDTKELLKVCRQTASDNNGLWYGYSQTGRVISHFGIPVRSGEWDGKDKTTICTISVSLQKKQELLH